MSLFAKENLRTIGEGINSTGYVISGIGLIAPLIAITAAIITVANNKTSNSRRSRSDGGQNNITIINFPSNQSPSPSLCNSSFPNFSFPNKNSSEDDINLYCNYCKFGNIIGILLAIALEVPWVALILGGLWLTGAGTLLLGKSIIAYAESLPSSRSDEPGNDAEPLPLANSMSPASAPPMDPSQPGNEPGNDAKHLPSVPPSGKVFEAGWPAHPPAYFALPPSAPPLELSERVHDGFYPGLP